MVVRQDVSRTNAMCEICEQVTCGQERELDRGQYKSE